MTYSSLSKRVMQPNGKWSSRKGNKVSMFIIHHWAGVYGGIERLVYSRDQASANYILLNTGELIASVPEEYRAWTSGNASYDNKAITIEIQNVSVKGWTVADVQIEKTAQLIADVAKRYKWSKIDRTNVIGHRDVRGAATACPGPYLYPRINKIIERANQIWKGSAPKKTTTPAKTSSEFTVRVTANVLNIRSGAGTKYKVVGSIKDKGVYTIVQQSGRWGKLKSGKGWIHLDYTTRNTAPVKKATPAKKSNEQVAREVLAGKWGNGADRKARLTKAGYNYNTIQAIVNRLV